MLQCKLQRDCKFPVIFNKKGFNQIEELVKHFHEEPVVLEDGTQFQLTSPLNRRVDANHLQNVQTESNSGFTEKDDQSVSSQRHETQLVKQEPSFAQESKTFQKFMELALLDTADAEKALISKDLDDIHWYTEHLCEMVSDNEERLLRILKLAANQDIEIQEIVEWRNYQRVGINQIKTVIKELKKASERERLWNKLPDPPSMELQKGKYAAETQIEPLAFESSAKQVVEKQGVADWIENSTAHFDIQTGQIAPKIQADSTKNRQKDVLFETMPSYEGDNATTSWGAEALGDKEKTLARNRNTHSDGAIYAGVTTDPMLTILQQLAKTQERLALRETEDAAATPAKVNQQIRLPKLEIEPFSGDSTDWQRFIDAFEATVDNAELSDVTKFSYLRSFLRGEAQRSLAGLSIIAKNYKVAKDLLQDRFGRTSIIKTKIMTSFTKLEDVRSDRDLRSLYDKVQKGIRNLSALGEDPDGYGGLLVPLIRKRLPKDLNVLLNRKKGDDEWTIIQLQEQLEIELKAREDSYGDGSPATKSERTNSKTSAGSYYNNSEWRRKPQLHQSWNDDQTTKPKSALSNWRDDKALLTQPSSNQTNSQNSSTADRKFTFPCVFCEARDHRPVDCSKVSNATSRKEKLMALRRCYNCFSQKHLVSGCESKNRCETCKGKHHTAIHPDKDDEAKEDSKSSQEVVFS